MLHFKYGERIGGTYNGVCYIGCSYFSKEESSTQAGADGDCKLYCTWLVPFVYMYIHECVLAHISCRLFYLFIYFFIYVLCGYYGVEHESSL